MTYQWATASHQGRIRKINEDAAYPPTSGRSDAPKIVAVADGMGGAVAGEVASAVALETAIETEGTVEERVAAANTAVLAEVERRPELSGMGTTLTIFELGVDGESRFAHVGDSRAYLLRGSELVQITTDHTVVNEYLMAGAITPDEVRTHPQRSMITRALGLAQDVDIDVGERSLQVGDRLLLCSDGVNAMLEEDRIAQLLGTGSPEEAAWALVEAANKAGGHDNITALVVDREA